MEQEPFDTKTQLFFAGVREFAARGYKAATVRDICRRADAANLNAVNYYFGGKEGLYRAILNAMFGELGKRWAEVDAAAPHGLPPEDRLKHYMTIYCTLLYTGDDLARAFTAIFLSEMVRPSPFLQDSLADSVVPQTQQFLRLLAELLGPVADGTAIRRCLICVIGPLLYPATVRTAAEEFFRESVVDDLPGFVDHAYRFALGGIEAIRTKALRGDINKENPS